MASGSVNFSFAEALCLAVRRDSSQIHLICTALTFPTPLIFSSSGIVMDESPSKPFDLQHTEKMCCASSMEFMPDTPVLKMTASSSASESVSAPSVRHFS